MPIYLTVNGDIFKFLGTIIDQIDWKVCPKTKKRYYIYHYVERDAKHTSINDYEGIFKQFIENQILIKDSEYDEVKKSEDKKFTPVDYHFKEFDYRLDIGPDTFRFNGSIAREIYRLLNFETPEDHKRITYGVDIHALATSLYRSFPSFFRSPTIAPNFIDVFIQLGMFDVSEVLFQDTYQRYKLIRLSELGKISLKP